MESRTTSMPPYAGDQLVIGRSSASCLARRFVAMGLSQVPPVFPAAGVSLYSIAPWWRVWARDPRHNLLQNQCASVYPVVARGLLALKPDAPVPQSVFAGLLPLHRPESVLDDWTEWTLGASQAKNYPGPAPLLGVLEHLLRPEPESRQIATWARLWECCFDLRGGFRAGSDDQAVALLEAIGRSGLRALASWVVSVLQNRDSELVLAGLACLVRLGVPDTDMPGEVLLNRLHPDMVESGRAALAFAETGDADLLAELIRADGWCERVQCLRLVEAVLVRGPGASPPPAGCLDDLLDLLLVHLGEEGDRDVVRCLAVTLGLAARACGGDSWNRIVDAISANQDPHRVESLLNALLLGQLPSSAFTRLENLRPQVAGLNARSVRALNRVLMSIGDSSGTPRDWLESAVAVFLQMGVLELPEAVRGWFDSPGHGPETTVAWLLERMESGLAATLCGAALSAAPGFVATLERIWLAAAGGGNSQTLQVVGGLLAGAADDCEVTAAELRCCLGNDLGGPLPESPEVTGQLLGLVVTEDKAVRRSAEELLWAASPNARTIAGYCLRRVERNSGLFEENRQRLGRFGIPAIAGGPGVALPALLAAWVGDSAPPCSDPGRLLEALRLPGIKGAEWVRRCIDWESPDAVRSVFGGIEPAVLAEVFLQASSAPQAAPRRLAGWLAAGLGLALAETPSRDRLLQRVVYLAAHDPDAEVRQAGTRAAEALGITERVPATPPPPSNVPVNSDPGSADPADEALEQLLSEIGSHLEEG
jgi:hypothetical protein